MPPLVSILIPAYNAEAYIADTLRSAVAQTWPGKEIIVVDDGSADRTLAIARQFESAGVLVFTQSNSGAAAARNRAFALSHGQYIQWLDADDLLGPEKIATQMRAAAQGAGPRTLFSSEWGGFMYRPARAKFVPTSLWCDLRPVEYVTRALKNNNWMQPAAWLVSRELTASAGPWDTRLSLDDDGEYFTRVVLASEAVRFVAGARTYYRYSANSLSTMGRSDKKWESQFLSIKLKTRHLRDAEDTPAVRAACIACLQRYLAYFHPERADLVSAAQEIAAEMGATLAPPHLPWKYSWIQMIFGWSAARRVQFSYNQLKASVLRAWDKAMLSLQRHGSNCQPG